MNWDKEDVLLWVVLLSLISIGVYGVVYGHHQLHKNDVREWKIDVRHPN